MGESKGLRRPSTDRSGNDRFARALAAAAVFFAALSCYFAFTSSPLYRGNLPELNYYYRQSNAGLQSDGRYASTIDVYVDNDSPNPAREVFIVVNTYDDLTPQISASTQFVTHDSQPGQKVIKLDLVPANGIAHVSVKSRLREYPDEVNPFPFKPWLEAPSVSHVYTEHGWVNCRYDECQRDFASTSKLQLGAQIRQTDDNKEASGGMTVRQAAQHGLPINGGQR